MSDPGNAANASDTPAVNPDLPNFLRLYEELGVRPDEGMARLTERYRLRLRALDPDLRDAAGLDLGWLTRSYRDAVAFQRRHGRLPGAAGPQAGGPAEWPRWPLRSARHPRRASVGQEEDSAGLWRWRWMLAGAALTLLVLALAQGR